MKVPLDEHADDTGFLGTNPPKVEILAGQHPVGTSSGCRLLIMIIAVFSNSRVDDKGGYCTIPNADF